MLQAQGDDEVLDRFDPNYRYALVRHSFEVDFCNQRKAGFLKTELDLNGRLSNLPGALPLGGGLSLKYKVGDYVPITTDLNNEPGTLLVSHEERRVVMGTIARIRQLEALDGADGGLYDVVDELEEVGNKNNCKSDDEAY